MKRSLAHLPRHKREQLKVITATIREVADDVEMIILFGSHARGDWVEDEYTEGHITYTYISDYDILVVPERRKTARNVGLWKKARREIRSVLPSPGVGIIAHHIDELNKQIARGSYFFTDIKKEGILLYDSKRHKLARVRKLDPQERHERASEDFRHWFRKAKGFLKQHEYALRGGEYKIAAFELHQATEHAYHALLLVFASYKRKLHDIEELGSQASAYCCDLLKVFPRATPEEDRLFDLLKRSYVDARYKASFKITRQELEYLAQKVRRLHTVVRKACKQYIESFGADSAR